MWIVLPSVSLALVLLAGRANGEGPFKGFDPLAIYGAEHEFAVMRNGEQAGWHRLRFEETPGGLIVSARFELDVRVLFFTAYRYRYRSVAEWQNGEIVRLDAQTNDDGKVSRVVAERQGDGTLRVVGPDGTHSAPYDILPTNHWNPQVVAFKRVLNTITGQVNVVEIRDLGEEEIATSAGSLRARHYLYTGDLHNEVWYDATGRWVKMRFRAGDGSVIDYICRTCGVRGNREM